MEAEEAEAAVAEERERGKTGRETKNKIPAFHLSVKVEQPQNSQPKHPRIF